jgi:ABC-2 type transport system ATP-binding protein
MGARPADAAAPPAIEIDHLVVRRGGKPILPDLSLSVSRGVVTGLLGPSGSGKTTLMRAIVGVQRVAGGSTTVLGSPAGTPELRRRVAYVTQAPSVYLDLTVVENLRYFASVLNTPEADVERVIETVGLQPQAGQVVGTLSGGERSRASLAAALLGAPELVILDEPTVGLDPVLRRELWHSFHELAAQGVTLLVSTHVMDEASYCDELVLLRGGHVIAHAPPAELLARTGTTDLEDAFLALAEATPDAVKGPQP